MRAPTRWQVQEAKNRLSEVMRKAREEGPQLITARGQEAAVLISIEEYRRLSQPRENLFEFMQRSPWRDIEIDIARSRETGRDVDL